MAEVPFASPRRAARCPPPRLGKLAPTVGGCPQMAVLEPAKPFPQSAGAELPLGALGSVDARTGETSQPLRIRARASLGGDPRPVRARGPKQRGGDDCVLVLGFSFFLGLSCFQARSLRAFSSLGGRTRSARSPSSGRAEQTVPGHLVALRRTRMREKPRSPRYSIPRGLRRKLLPPEVQRSQLEFPARFPFCRPPALRSPQTPVPEANWTTLGFR